MELERSVLGSSGEESELEPESEVSVPDKDYLRWVQGSLNLYLEKKGRSERTTADGKDSAGYRKAVKLFKTLAKIKPVDDKVDEKTQNELIRSNESNPKYLAWLRTALDKAGYPHLTIAYGKHEKPVAAIREFQRDYTGRFGFSLNADSFVGAKTHLALLHALHSLKPKPKPPKPSTPTEVTDEQLNYQLLRAEEWIREYKDPEREQTLLCILAKLKLKTTDDGYFPRSWIHKFFDATIGSGASLLAYKARRHLKAFLKARRDTNRPVTPEDFVGSLQRLVEDILDGIRATQFSYCYDPRLPGVQQKIKELSRRHDSLYSCPLIRREVDAMKRCAG